MHNPLAEISLDLATQLEEAFRKEASLSATIKELESENNQLKAKLEVATNEAMLNKKASNAFNAAMLSATTSLEQVGFISPGSAVKAYQTLISNQQEIPVLLEKLASAISGNFNEGSAFSEEPLTKKASKQSDPWLGLLEPQ